ncbi:hypothetical protein G6F24_017005 [Rhizopus arrhizus]|nr:hypothetical protein G6F24_017005 [Rhizopus arrhizus]
MDYLRTQAGAKYPAAVADLAIRHGPAWLADIDAHPPSGTEWALADAPLDAPAADLTLLADVAELKLPWLAGYSRRVAQLAARCGALLGMGPAAQDSLQAAALGHGSGRAALPNRLWNTPGKLSRA